MAPTKAHSMPFISKTSFAIPDYTGQKSWLSSFRSFKPVAIALIHAVDLIAFGGGVNRACSEVALVGVPEMTAHAADRRRRLAGLGF